MIHQPLTVSRPYRARIMFLALSPGPPLRFSPGCHITGFQPYRSRHDDGDHRAGGAFARIVHGRDGNLDRCATGQTGERRFRVRG